MAPQQQAADPDAKLKSLFTKLDTALKSQTGSLKKSLKLIDSSERQDADMLGQETYAFAAHVIAVLQRLVTSAVLALAPGDADALKCRVVVLIQYDEFQQALDAIAADAAIADDLLFEKVGNTLLLQQKCARYDAERCCITTA
jgi:hypothetical protein